MASRPAIYFALTSHGLGHITRSVAVIRALHALAPEISVHVSSTADPCWLRNELGFDASLRRQSFEPGAVQKNCFVVDVAATISAYRDLERRYDDIFDEEVRFLRDHNIAAVVSDIPALPVAAAAEVGIPAIGVSNFTWDWILELWCAPDDVDIVERLRTDYAKGTHQLRLPFGPECSSFPASEPAPLVARTARMPKEDVKRRLALTDEPIAVVCPGGWSVDDWPSIEARPGPFQLVTVNDLPVTTDVQCVKLGADLPFGITMPDLVNAADVVLGKPGYGLASECLRHRTPFAMIDRPNFRETPCLVADMRAMGRCTTLSIDEFFTGEWADVLAAAPEEGSDWVELVPEPEREIAARILSLAGI